MWEEITIPVYAKHRRYGTKAGLANPNFLNAELFIESVLAPYEDEAIRRHCGPFVFQFQALRKEWTDAPSRFLEQLDAFLARLPKHFLYATEVRNEELLSSDYFALLNRHGATHCFNHWTQMPPLRKQMQAGAAAGGLTAPFYVCRLLTPLGVSYQQAVERFQPYNSLQEPNQALRQDVVTFARRAVERNVPAFVVVNNRCEGYAPGTIDAIGNEIVMRMAADEVGTPT